MSLDSHYLLLLLTTTACICWVALFVSLRAPRAKSWMLKGGLLAFPFGALAALWSPGTDISSWMYGTMSVRALLVGILSAGLAGTLGLLVRRHSDHTYPRDVSIHWGWYGLILVSFLTVGLILTNQATDPFYALAALLAACGLATTWMHRHRAGISLGLAAIILLLAVILSLGARFIMPGLATHVLPGTSLQGSISWSGLAFVLASAFSIAPLLTLWLRQPLRPQVPDLHSTKSTRAVV
jgi:hypothetical protein